jgi:hypothetical protein
MHKIRLCVLIGRILDTQYKLGRHRRLTSSEHHQMLLLPRLSGSATAEYMARDQELRKWGADSCTRMHDLVQKDPWRNSSVVGVHCAVLEMLYFTVVGLVHRPQLLNSHPEDSAARALQDFSRDTLREAAQRITEIAKYLDEADLLRFLPPIGVTSLLAAAMQHIKEAVSSPTPQGRSAVSQRLNETMQPLVRLQEIYYSADHAVAFLELVRNKPRDTSPEIGQRMSTAALYRDGAIKYATPRSTSGREGRNTTTMALNLDEWNNGNPGVSSLSSTTVATFQFDGVTDIGQTGVAETAYDNDDFHADEFDFESLLNLHSDVVLSENLDIADFDVVNWRDLFQVRD